MTLSEFEFAWNKIADIQPQVGRVVLLLAVMFTRLSPIRFLVGKIDREELFSAFERQGGVQSLRSSLCKS